MTCSTLQRLVQALSTSSCFVSNFEICAIPGLNEPLTRASRLHDAATQHALRARQGADRDCAGVTCEAGSTSQRTPRLDRTRRSGDDRNRQTPVGSGIRPGLETRPCRQATAQLETCSHRGADACIKGCQALFASRGQAERATSFPIRVFVAEGSSPVTDPARRGCASDVGPPSARRPRSFRWRSRPISRVLSWTVIPLGAPSPVRSSNLPGPDAGNVMRSLFGLAPGGVCRAGLLPGSRCALTAPFHPCRPAEAVLGGIFLLHFPSARAAQALPGTLPCGARTFLGIAGCEHP